MAVKIAAYLVDGEMGDVVQQLGHKELSPPAIERARVNTIYDAGKTCLRR